MEKADKIIKCRECGTEFTFTVGEQEFYEEKGYVHEPVRCKECRDKKKNENKDNKKKFNHNNYKPNF